MSSSVQLHEGLFRRHLLPFASGLRKPNRNRLLWALHLFPTLAAPLAAFLSFMHSLLHGVLSAFPISCHRATLLFLDVLRRMTMRKQLLRGARRLSGIPASRFAGRLGGMRLFLF